MSLFVDEFHLLMHSGQPLTETELRYLVRTDPRRLTDEGRWRQLIAYQAAIEYLQAHAES